MSRIAIAALLLLAAQPALAADPPWRAAWYQVEMFPAVQIGGTPYDDKAACERDLMSRVCRGRLDIGRVIDRHGEPPGTEDEAERRIAANQGDPVERGRAALEVGPGTQIAADLDLRSVRIPDRETAVRAARDQTRAKAKRHVNGAAVSDVSADQLICAPVAHDAVLAAEPEIVAIDRVASPREGIERDDAALADTDLVDVERAAREYGEDLAIGR